MPAIDVSVELFINNAWEDITAYVRDSPGVDITFGVQQETATADPSTATMVLNNRDGRFSTRNSAGAYYPYLTRNTPLRVLVGTTERFRGEVSELPSRWDPAHADVYVPVTASGIMRRLARANAIESPMRSTIRQLAAQFADITAYWPLEDRPGTTSPQPAAWDPGVGQPDGGVITGSPIYQAVDPGVMSDPVPTWENASGSFAVPSDPSTEWMAQALVVFPAAGELTGGEELWRVEDAGTGRSWRMLYSAAFGGNVLLQVINSVGAEVYANPVSIPFGLDGRTVRVSLQARNSGTSVEFFLGLAGVAALAATIPAIQLSRVTRMQIGGGTIPLGAAVGVGHLAVGTDYTALSGFEIDDSLVGFAGESVEQRIDRLEAATGMAIGVVSGAEQPVELGVQSPGTLLDVLREMEKADAGGILRDSINLNTLTYRTRWSRYNNHTGNDLALDYTAGHISAIEPTDDDAALRNDVTINRTGGSSARAELEAGPLSVQDYPDGVGRYAFGDTLSTYLDSELRYVAGWILGLGTVDETRFPRVTIDLARNPGLVTDLESLRPGDQVTIANLPTFAGAEDVTLQVIGWTEHLDTVNRRVTLNCVPGESWHVVELDDATYGELDEMRLAL